MAWSSLLADLQERQSLEMKKPKLADNTLDLKWQKPFTSHEQILSAQKANHVCAYASPSDTKHRCTKQ